MKLVEAGGEVSEGNKERFVSEEQEDEEVVKPSTPLDAALTSDLNAIT